MSAYVYIIRSETLDQHYIGISKFKEKRVRQHRKGTGQWTRRAEDWTLIWQEEVASTAAARALEKRIKARGAKRFVEGRGPAMAGQAPPVAG